MKTNHGGYRLLTRRDVNDRLEKILRAHDDIAQKARRLKDLENAVATELHDLEAGVLSLQDELTPKARSKMLVRLDRLRACLDEVRKATDDLHRPADLRLATNPSVP
jgi:Skp family chaperone for outer membrane proteins